MMRISLLDSSSTLISGRDSEKERLLTVQRTSLLPEVRRSKKLIFKFYLYFNTLFLFVGKCEIIEPCIKNRSSREQSWSHCLGFKQKQSRPKQNAHSAQKLYSRCNSEG